MGKKRKTVKNMEKDLATARSSARNAQNRLKAYKEGIQEGIKISKEARS